MLIGPLLGPVMYNGVRHSLRIHFQSNFHRENKAKEGKSLDILMVP